MNAALLRGLWFNVEGLGVSAKTGYCKNAVLLGGSGIRVQGVRLNRKPHKRSVAGKFRG
jgi:membrane carboxypeptidase/penicillin-binding protein PbpC